MKHVLGGAGTQQAHNLLHATLEPSTHAKKTVERNRRALIAIAAYLPPVPCYPTRQYPQSIQPTESGLTGSRFRQGVPLIIE